MTLSSLFDLVQCEFVSKSLLQTGDIFFQLSRVRVMRVVRMAKVTWVVCGERSVGGVCGAGGPVAGSEW